MLILHTDFNPFRVFLVVFSFAKQIMQNHISMNLPKIDFQT